MSEPVPLCGLSVGERGSRLRARESTRRLLMSRSATSARFCAIVDQPTSTAIWKGDVIYRDPQVTALMSLHWWQEDHGNALVIPNDHYENLLAIRDDTLAAVHRTSELLARAMLDYYACHGITVRQNNGPAGNQDVWHYHVRVAPRYTGDDYPVIPLRRSTPDERQPFTNRLRQWFGNHVPTPQTPKPRRVEQ